MAKETTATGNPRFLEGLLTCIDKRCRILGLDAPHKIQLSPEEIRDMGARVANILNRYVPLEKRKEAMLEILLALKPEGKPS